MSQCVGGMCSREFIVLVVPLLTIYDLKGSYLIFLLNESCHLLTMHRSCLQDYTVEFLTFLHASIGQTQMSGQVHGIVIFLHEDHYQPKCPLGAQSLHFPGF